MWTFLNNDVFLYQRHFFFFLTEIRLVELASDPKLFGTSGFLTQQTGRSEDVSVPVKPFDWAL